MSNKLIIIRGPCGVGKTTVADKLRLKLKNSILINLDYIVNKMLGLKPELKSLNIALKHSFILSEEFTKKKQDIIIDQALYNLKIINRIKNYFTKKGYKIYIFTLITDLEKLKKNCANRKHMNKTPIKKIIAFNKLFSDYKIKTIGTIIINNNLNKTVSQIYDEINS